MITQASDYKFVDFANGSMYTGEFDGNILPLRQGGDRNIVKAEDIAFLHECIADKRGAFKNAYMLGHNVSLGGSTLTPTGGISSLQIRGIYQYLKDQLETEFKPGYTTSNFHGYLQRYPHEISAFDKSADDYTWSKYTHLIDYISLTCGGTWTPTASESDFAAGKPIEVTPIAQTFDDAKHLDKPTVCSYVWDNYRQNIRWVQTGGSSVSSPADSPGWYMYDLHDPDIPSSTYQGWYCIPNGSTVTLAELADDYLSNAQLWLVYGASCHENDGQSTSKSSAAGVIYMDAGGYCAKTHALNKITWKQSTINSTSLISRIISDCGWTRQTTGSSLYIQDIRIEEMMFILVGIPNARTKWWSD